ncbi:sulfonate ABC transporter substrate-binding protein [Leptolyngbya sp. FACHB-36]|uniref:sulfonate ABC transporter substrate-binding protein n=1 Tax=Leptolyngbya sp. FACHB-36 TaxID=2692808 RepID=UPI001680DBDB|nr:sulfonate ABC transporter substrate-binding protein [Leptolyngbya sp. FACHB-36]MBD2018599.1 sulfonate ABC transporter substrate-binding protein [Leptolyngbya sp. FACHB-36]
MTLKRRDVLLGLTSLGLPILAASCTNNSSNSTTQSSPSSGQAASPASSTSSGSGPVRIGYQKSTIMLKSRGTIDKRLNSEGVQVEWKEFPAGPPLLEALNAGAIDIGPVGESPPIFAQAAGANLVYAASIAPNPKGSGVLVREDSLIKAVTDLKGKKVTFAKGSSANLLIVQLLEKDGLKFEDIEPVYLPPADARAAFVQGTVDAWVIWDPFFAAGETGIKSRVVANGEGVNRIGGYYIASRQFATERPAILKALLEEVRDLEEWSGKNRDEVAEVLTKALKLDATAVKTATDRRQFGLRPVTDDLLAEQQKVADVYYQLKLIPKPIKISDTVLPPDKVAAYALS